MDAQQLARAFAKHCFRSVLAVNEFVTLAWDGALLAFRVTAAYTLDAAAREVRPQHAEVVLQSYDLAVMRASHVRERDSS